jgi:hypothetical protein
MKVMREMLQSAGRRVRPLAGENETITVSAIQILRNDNRRGAWNSGVDTGLATPPPRMPLSPGEVMDGLMGKRNYLIEGVSGAPAKRRSAQNCSGAATSHSW